MKETYCNSCDAFVKYYVKDTVRTLIDDGEMVEYDVKEAICTICGNEVFADECVNFNSIQHKKALGEIQEIITIEEIKDILVKYNIGKRPLSELLGWGSITITRYIDGSQPTLQYSRVLKDLYESPKIFGEILEKNKSNVSEVTYKKAQKAVEIAKNKLLLESKCSDKLENIISYILSREILVTETSLQKLLYYIQAFSSYFYNDFLFEEQCEAWESGPVFRNVNLQYLEFKFKYIPQIVAEHRTMLSKLERKLIDSILGSFGLLTGKTLVDLTCGETPWMKSYYTGNDVGTISVINRDIIQNYFGTICKKYMITSVNDIKNYAIEGIKSL